MTRASLSPSLADFLADHAALIDRLYLQAQAARWQLARERFAEALHRSSAKRFSGCAFPRRELEAYLQSLELEDLALACACGCGHPPAWEFFVARYQPQLRSAARGLLGAGDVRADELADSLFADFYGLRPDGQVRSSSLFNYFHGRSKLGTWLHSVLAQRHVDALRSSRRAISLDPGGGETSPPPEPFAEPAPADPDRQRYLARFDDALTAALAELPARDRLRLAYFYLDQRTLAEIGRALSEHESTASRQLERTRRALHKRVTEILSRAAPLPAPARAAADGRPEPKPDLGLDPAQIELAFEYALASATFDLSRALSGADADAGAGSG